MKVIQKVFIQMMVKNVEKAIQMYDIVPASTYLSIVGGYALNCPTNSYLVKNYNFKGFIAPSMCKRQWY